MYLYYIYTNYARRPRGYVITNFVFYIYVLVNNLLKCIRLDLVKLI